MRWKGLRERWLGSNEIFGLILIGVLLILSALQPPITDQDGFGATITALPDAEHHGIPLLQEPSPGSPVIRRIERFEGCLTSGKKANGYVQVKMVRDRVIGWLPADVVKPSLSRAFGRAKQAMLASAHSFFPALVSWRSLLSMALGMVAATIRVKWLGRDVLERPGMASMLAAAISAFGTNIVLRELVPFSRDVAVVEYATARGCLLLRYIMPAMVAALLANFVFTRHSRVAAGMEALGAFTFFFLFYSYWGALAAWW